MTAPSRPGAVRPHLPPAREPSYDGGRTAVPAALSRPARRDADHSTTHTRQAGPFAEGRSMKEGLEP